MSFSVADLLAMPELEPARAQVVTGTDLDRRDVRWLHTSEIYEIAPLLRGGEVLLTTGLGLVGTAPAAQAAYVRALASRHVAALMMELGRTFTTLPPAMVEAARETGFPLVALHGVVRFVEVTEAVHAHLLAGQLQLARLRESLTDRMHDAAVDSAVDGVLAVAGQQLGVPVTLRLGDAAADPGVLSVPVPGPPPARVCAAVDGTAEAAEVLRLCARVVAITRRRTEQDGPLGAPRLLATLASGVPVSAQEADRRAASVGFHLPPDHRAVALLVSAQTSASGPAVVTAVSEAARAVLGKTLVHRDGDEVLVAAAVRAPALRSRLEELADTLDAELAATVGGRVRRVCAGQLVPDVGGLARSIPQAREAAVLADALQLGSRTVLAGDLGVYRLLATLVRDEDLEQFVQEQLGPLLDQDATQGSELVATLDAYLESGLSKTRAAAMLGVRRQTLYSRLQRISRVLGDLELADRQRRTALDLALVSWRLRTAAATSAPGRRR